MSPATRRLVAVVQALALSSCLLTGEDALVKPGGAEDFPNTVTTLGRIAVADVSAGTDWEQLQNVEIPEMPEIGGLDSLQVAPPTAKFAVLGKTAVDTLDMNLWQLDMNRLFEAYFFGRVYAYAVDSTAQRVRRDTVTALYFGPRVLSASLFDSIQADPGKYLLPMDYRGAIRAVATGVVQTYWLRNMDSQGDMDLAEYATITPEPGGGTHRRWIRIHGPEGAFRAAGAVPEELEILRRGPAGDTLEWTLARDADWDRRLWTDSARGVVDVFLRVRNSPERPQLLRMNGYVRAEFRHDPVAGDSLRQLLYEEQKWLRDGRAITFTLRGLGSGNWLAAGDSARMAIDTVYGLRDSAIKYSAVYNLVLGPDPLRMEDHRLAGYAIRKFWRRGSLFSTQSVFLPDEPVPMGQAGFEGVMSSTAAYVGGDTVQTQGRVGPEGFNLTLRRLSAGVEQTFEVVLDASGKLLEVSPVVPDATATPRRAP